MMIASPAQVAETIEEISETLGDAGFRTFSGFDGAELAASTHVTDKRGFAYLLVLRPVCQHNGGEEPATPDGHCYDCARLVAEDSRAGAGDDASQAAAGQEKDQFSPTDRLRVSAVLSAVLDEMNDSHSPRAMFAPYAEIVRMVLADERITDDLGWWPVG